MFIWSVNDDLATIIILLPYRIYLLIDFNYWNFTWCAVLLSTNHCTLHKNLQSNQRCFSCFQQLRCHWNWIVTIISLFIRFIQFYIITWPKRAKLWLLNDRGQSIAKAIALVGCYQCAVVSSYQKWSKAETMVNMVDFKILIAVNFIVNYSAFGGSKQRSLYKLS